MIIGVGWFELDPGDRDAFIEASVETMRSCRSELGCLEYTFAPDPVEPGRVVLIEKWESQVALDAHLAAMSSRRADGQPSLVTPKAASVTLYETASETKLI